MKRLGVLILIVSASVLGCDDDNPTSPTNAPLVFTASLSPASEVPAIANAEASGIGAAQITFDVTRDSSNNITGGVAAFHFQLSGFPASTTAFAAHIHSAPAGVNGPIVVNTGITAATAVAMNNGLGLFTGSGIVVDPGTLQAIVNNPAAFYFNVHSPLNPGGFARGQLRRAQ